MKETKDREATKNNPVIWLADEINEMRAEELFTPEWQSEWLDVLGLISLHFASTPLVINLAAYVLKNEEFNQGIQQPGYSAWVNKNAKKGRSAIPIADLTYAKMKVKAAQEQLSNMSTEKLAEVNSIMSPLADQFKLEIRNPLVKFNRITNPN